MLRVLQASYFWDTKKATHKKRNQDIGTLISYFFVLTYFLFFIFAVSGGIYPILQNFDFQTLGYESSIVSILGFIANRWWLIFLIFLLSLLVVISLVFLISRTNIGEFQVNLTLLKDDVKNLQEKSRLILIYNILTIAGFSFISFLVLEIISFALSSIMFIFTIPLILSNNSFGVLYLVILITQIIVFPILLFIYDVLIKRRKLSPTDMNFKEFINEEGEIDLEKWRIRTWGKKPYSFDWNGEEYFPISCFSCGSIISSNLTECPICQADLVKEIEEIDAEYTTDENDNSLDSDQISGKEKK